MFHAYPTEGIALADRCLTHLADDQHDLAMRLVQHQWILHVLISDAAALMAATRLLRDSPTPLAQVYGYGTLGVSVGMTDRVKSANVLQRSHEILQTLPAGPDTTQAAAGYAVWAGLSALHAAEFDVALQYAQQALALQDELGYETEFSAHASMLEAVSALLLGDPGTALEAANRYARLSLALGTGDEIKALVHVAFGHFESARTAAKAHAQVAITGRVPHQATESLLVLAALAEAEGNVPTGRDLITNAGRFGQQQLRCYESHLARKLGVDADFETAQRSLYTLDERATRQRATRQRATRQRATRQRATRQRATNATETLRREMTRRGWQ